MIQPTAGSFARKAKPPAGCPTGGFEYRFLSLVLGDDGKPVSA